MPIDNAPAANTSQRGELGFPNPSEPARLCSLFVARSGEEGTTSNASTFPVGCAQLTRVTAEDTLYENLFCHLARNPTSKRRFDMRALRFHQFGSFDNLKMETLPDPQPKPDEVVVRIRAVILSRGAATTGSHVRKYGDFGIDASGAPLSFILANCCLRTPISILREVGVAQALATPRARLAVAIIHWHGHGLRPRDFDQ